MEAEGVVIQPVQDFQGYRACERLQKEVWGFPDLSVVPDHLIHMVVQAGGLLLGAFDGPGPAREMLGFSLSTVGLWHDKTICHHSLLTAVRPGWQDKGVGRKLKLAQREQVLAQGIDLITWTFDPLESRNAHFNLNKLGGVVRSYIPNYFGEELRDARNRGLPPDRFLCEWHLSSPRVVERLSHEVRPDPSLGEVAVINRTQRTASGLRAPAGTRENLSEPYLLFEIPADLQVLKRTSLELARAWRMESRKGIPPYLEAGYIITGLFREGDRSFLVFRRGDLREVLARS